MQLSSYLLLFLAVQTALIALPEGFKVAAGDVKTPQIDPNGTMLIESGKRAIVDWNSFSISNQEVVRFLQPDAKSAILNRVSGFSQSKINGSLLANGQVFLINPNGVVIGPGGVIQAAAFIASTSHLLDEDFLQGKEMSFKGISDSSIVNLGKIIASDGDILFIGSRILNEGELQAKEGIVGLACGREILVRPEGKERIFVKVPITFEETPQEEEGFLLDQSGTIEALSLELKSNTENYVKAIRHSGKAEAFSIMEEGGSVYLVAEGGSSVFSGDIKGREVQVLGKEVFLEKGTISTSSENKGGTVLIGGDYQGSHPEILNAINTYVGPDVTIDANAFVSGDGGKVIIWGDEAAYFYGNVHARGGIFGGDGGFIEVSGNYLDFNGFADRSAPQGNPGTLLLDPINIQIIPPGVNSTNVLFVAPNYTFTSCSVVPLPANTARITTTSINTNLGTGNVIINTSTPVGNTCAGAGNITFNSGTIVSFAGHSLSLIADNTIAFTSGNISISGALSLSAVNGITITTSAIQTGPLSMSTSNGNLNIHDAIISSSQTASFNIAGNLLVDTPVGLPVTQIGGSSGLSATVSGNITLSSSGGLTFGFGSNLVGDINVSAGGTITVEVTADSALAILGSFAGHTPFATINATAVGDVNIISSASGALAAIGLDNFNESVSGNTNVTSQTGSINLTTSNGGFAYIGAFNTPPLGYIPPNNITVKAANNIVLTTTSASDVINIGNTGMTNPSNANITIVSDNAFPSSLGSGGIQSSGPGTIQFFTAPGNQLSFYTVSPTQNTFPSSINGAVFPPQPANANNNYQQFGVFFPGGTYIGPQYMIFYKLALAPIPSPPAPIQTVVATTVLGNVLTSPTSTSTVSQLGPQPTQQETFDESQHTPFNNVQSGSGVCH